MKIKKKHVGQEFIYKGKDRNLLTFDRLAHGEKVKLKDVFKSSSNNKICAIINANGAEVYCYQEDLSFSTIFPLEPQIFTGEMIKKLADDVLDFQNRTGSAKVTWRPPYNPKDGERDTVEVSIPSGTFKFSDIDSDKSSITNGYKETIDDTLLSAAIKMGNAIDDRTKKASINKASPEFENLKAASELVERQLYDVKYPDIHMEDDDHEDPSTSIPLDQETADAIKAMVDKMVGKRLVDFGVGYASPDSTDDQSITTKRLINSISIKVD